MFYVVALLWKYRRVYIFFEFQVPCFLTYNTQKLDTHMEVSITSVVMNSMLCSILSIFMVDLNGAIRLSETSARRHEIWLGKRHVVDGSDGVAGEASSIFNELSVLWLLCVLS
jgi:hypothetical protein